MSKLHKQDADDLHPPQPSPFVPGPSAILLVVLLGTLVHYVGVKGEGRSAINRWRPQVQALWTGTDVYTAYAFPTPPVMAVVLTPFCHLPGRWCMGLWFVAKSAMLLASMHLAVRGFRWRGPPALTTGWQCVLVVLCLRPMLSDLSHGNVNLWILFLLAVALTAFRDRRDTLCGLSLSLAAACKLTPLLLVAFLGWQRRWRALAWALGGLVLWWVVVPGALLGQRRNAELLTHWCQRIVLPYALHGAIDTEQVNQSLPALVHRLARPTLAIKPDDGRPPIHVNVLSLTPRQTDRLVKTLLAALVLAGLWRTWPQAPRESSRTLHDWSLWTMSMLLISERSWKHHYVVLLIPLTAVVLDLQAGRRKPMAWLSLAAVALALLTTSDLAEPLGHDVPKLVQAYGAYTLAALVLWSTHATAGTSRPRA